jgi:hypothetical protein
MVSQLNCIGKVDNEGKIIRVVDQFLMESENDI